MLKNIIDRHKTYFKEKINEFNLAKETEAKQEVEKEEAKRKKLEEEKASIENLKLKHSLFGDSGNGKTGIPYAYNQKRLFKAGEPKDHAEPAKNTNLEEYLRLHGSFL